MERCSPRMCKSAAVVVAALIGVAGCHQVSNPTPGLGLSDGIEERPVKLKPKQAADVQVALAHSLEMHGDTDKASALYEEAVTKDPGRGDALLRLAILRDQQGQFAESAVLYQQALKAQPGSAEIFCDMGYSLYLQNRWSEAEMNLRQAVALAPEHARAHNNLGMLLARSGKAEEALDEFRKGGCPDADAHVNLAFALTLEQQWPQARQHYQEALRTDPASVAAQKGMRELEQVIVRMNPAPGAIPTQPSDSTVTQVGTISPAQVP